MNFGRAGGAVCLTRIVPERLDFVGEPPKIFVDSRGNWVT
jgi:hypothetical protein